MPHAFVDSDRLQVQVSRKTRLKALPRGNPGQDWLPAEQHSRNQNGERRCGAAKPNVARFSQNRLLRIDCGAVKGRTPWSAGWGLPLSISTEIQFLRKPCSFKLYVDGKLVASKGATYSVP